MGRKECHQAGLPADLLSGIAQLEGAVTEKSPFKPAEVLQMHAERQGSAAASALPPDAAAAEQSAARHAHVPKPEVLKAPARPAEAPASAQMSRHGTDPLLHHPEAACCALYA